MLKRKINVLTLLLIIIFISTACGTNIDKDNEIIEDKVVEDNKIIKTFDSEVKEFNEIYKTALFATSKGKRVEAENATMDSYQQWKLIVKEYAQNQPAEYRKVGDWAIKLKELEKIEEDAIELVLKDKTEEAHEKLELFRERLMELRKESGIKNISDDMLVFHDILEEVVKTENREEVLKKMPDLKISFTVLKEYYQDNTQYKEMIKDLENIIAELDSVSEKRFDEVKLKLKPAFIALYIQFG